MNGDKKLQSEVTLKDVHDTLKELLKWTRFAGIKEVKPVLESKLDTDIKKIVYTLSDGKNSTRDIEKIAKGISDRSVSNYWQEWGKAGLGESIPVMGGGNRFKKSFDLEDFGIKVPDISKKIEKTEQSQAIEDSQITDQPKTEGQTNAI